MKILNILALLLLTLNISAQNFEVDFYTYNWDKNPIDFKTTSQDTAISYIMPFQKYFVFYEPIKEGVSRNLITHNCKFLLDDKAIEDNNKIYMPIYNHETLMELKVRVIKDGKIVFESTKNDLKEVVEEGKKYHLLAVQGLSKNCLMETLIRTKSGSRIYADYYPNTNFPVQNFSFTLISPKNLKFEAKAYNVKSTQIDTVIDEQRFIEITAKNIEPYSKESYSAFYANKTRIEYTFRENLSTGYKYAKYPEIGKSFFDSFNKDFEKNEKEIAKIIKSLKLDKITDVREKIFKIESYIKSNLAVEENAPDLASVSEMLKLKYANVENHSQLYYWIFRNLNIKTEIVLTTDKENKKFDPKFDSWSYINEILLYFPDQKMFLDPSRMDYRMGLIDQKNLNQEAVFVKTIDVGGTFLGAAYIKNIGANSKESGTDLENYTITFHPNLDSIDFHFHRTMMGYAEQNLRALYYLFDEDRRKEVFEPFVKGMAENAKIKNVKYENTDINDYEAMKKPFIIDANTTSSDFIEDAGENIIFKIGELIGRQVELYQEKNRVNDVELNYLHDYKRKIVVNIPKGYNLKGLEKLKMDFICKNDKSEVLCGFKSDYEVVNNQLIVTCDEYYNAIHYPVALFTDFQKTINAAADFNKIAILIEKQ